MITKFDNFKIYESLNKPDIMNFFNDFGYFLTLNLMKIQTYAIDDNAKTELGKMQNSLRSPLINGKNYAELLNDIDSIINNPKFLSLFLSQIKKLIEFIEPRIIKFVIDNDYKKNWLDKIQKFKQTYRNIIM